MSFFQMPSRKPLRRLQVVCCHGFICISNDCCIIRRASSCALAQLEPTQPGRAPTPLTRKKTSTALSLPFFCTPPAQPPRYRLPFALLCGSWSARRWARAGGACQWQASIDSDSAKIPKKTSSMIAQNCWFTAASLFTS